VDHPYKCRSGARHNARSTSRSKQGYQRARDDEKLLAFGPLIVDLMSGAAELAESTDYDVRA